MLEFQEIVLYTIFSKCVIKTYTGNGIQMAKKTLGKLETKLFSYVQMREKRAVEVNEIKAALDLSTSQVRELFRRLTDGNLVARVRPGFYLVPEKLPVGGSWTPGEALAINKLMEDCGGTYQVCGPNAFNRYGFTEQVPVRTYLYNDKLSGERTIGSVELILIKVSESRLGGTITEGQKNSIIYSSRARTLVDAVYDWSRFNTLPCAYDWIRQELTKNNIEASELVKMAVEFGNIGTCRRLGYLLDKLGVNADKLNKLKKQITDSSSFIPFNPTRPKRGQTNSKWNVVDNER